MKKKDLDGLSRRDLFYRAVTTTLPILCGYLFMGAAFGLLLQEAGYSYIWAIFMSVLVYAGTMQYMAIAFLVTPTSLWTVAITTLLVHFRHFVYGLSFIQKFRSFGWRKFYMMFGMTDETYALLCQPTSFGEKNEQTYFFFVTLLNHLYWIAGSVLGAVAGSFLTFNTKGIDFAMTALFIVIGVDQWRTTKTKWPACIGGVSALLSRLLFGAQNMLIPAILFMVISFLTLRNRLESVCCVTTGEG